MAAPRDATLRCGFEKKRSQSLWAWFSVGMTEQSTVARGVYGEPCSPSLFSPWSTVHLVHEPLSRSLPLLFLRGGASTGGERPFPSHGVSSAACIGSTEDLSARPCPARWLVRFGTRSHDGALERGSTDKVNASSSLTWLPSSSCCARYVPCQGETGSPPFLASTGLTR